MSPQRGSFLVLAATAVALCARPGLAQDPNDPAFRYRSGKHEIQIAFATTFKHIWDDKKSGAETNGSFWRPVAPQGWFPVGDLGVPNHDNPDGKEVAAVVKDLSGSATAPPTDYELVWTDRKSGASRDGSFWRPLPPPGFRAMGLVAQQGYSKPATNLVRCVRIELIQPGGVGQKIWTDRKSGAEKNFGAWEIKAAAAQAGEVTFSPGTFVGHGKHEAPATHACAQCFRRLKTKDHDVTDQQKVDLLTAYAPRVWLAKNEQYGPSSVEWAFRQMKRVKAADGKYWLHTKQELKSPSDNSLPLFRGDLNTAPVYAFWVDKSTDSHKIADLVYYFYYPYNRGKTVADTKFGNHVSDWEHITVRLTSAVMNYKGAASYTPAKVALSQHDHGETPQWNDVPKVRGTTHPIVFSAEGSHGCYLTAGSHQYKNIVIARLKDECSEGTAWDTFRNVRAFDYSRKAGLGGAAWPLWMSDDYTSAGKSGGDPADPANGPIFRWGNPKQGAEVFGESRLNDGPTGPIAKSVWDANKFE